MNNVTVKINSVNNNSPAHPNPYKINVNTNVLEIKMK